MSEVTKTVVANCTPRNFPIKSFYSTVTLACHTFYRQGQLVTATAAKPDDVSQEQITQNDLGNMYLVYDQALVVRSSNSILFFKIDEETGLWTNYFTFDDLRGQIFFIKGNIRIQVTTAESIYFYLIDKETFMPKLENVMYNFMECSQLMFGTRVRYAISFKINQPGF